MPENVGTLLRTSRAIRSHVHRSGLPENGKVIGNESSSCVQVVALSETGAAPGTRRWGICLERGVIARSAGGCAATSEWTFMAFGVSQLLMDTTMM